VPLVGAGGMRPMPGITQFQRVRALWTPEGRATASAGLRISNQNKCGSGRMLGDPQGRPLAIEEGRGGLSARPASGLSRWLTSSPFA